MKKLNKCTNTFENTVEAYMRNTASANACACDCENYGGYGGTSTYMGYARLYGQS